jgi:diguanylate cyclase (GGDEF)-like protein
MTTETLAGLEFDAALDTLATALRGLAKQPLPIDPALRDDVSERAERWAKHVLVLAPTPGSTSVARRRDWHGVRSFVQRARAVEVTEVAALIATLRQALWELLSRMQNVLAGSREDDEQVRGQVEALRHVVTEASPDRLREEVVRVAVALERVVTERAHRHAMHVEALSVELGKLSGELEEAQKAASEDPLTRTANRRAFDAYVDRCALLDGLCGRPTWLLMIDVDHFKQINDDFGHPAGDDVLRALGRALAKAFPRRTDFVARYGGEEFAVILREVRAEHLPALTERVLSAAREIEAGTGARARRVTVSIGAAALARGESAAQWIARADRALYAAKREGRDRVVVDGVAPAG